MDNSELLAFIDASVRQCPRKMFVSTPFAKEKSIRRMQNVCTKIRSILIDFKLNNVGGDVAAEKCSMYEAMNYRYSLSNRHQRFWKYSQQIHRELKRINQRKLQNNFQKFVELSESGNYLYKPNESAVQYLGCLILERIVRLDRMRIHCLKTVNESMGYVELEHFLPFAMTLIATAAEIAREAKLHIHTLRAIYDQLASWFCSYSDRFPISSSALQLCSINAMEESSTSPSLQESLQPILELLRKNEEEKSRNAAEFVHFKRQQSNVE